MQLGMIGLGRMGANMARRLRRAGHACVGYDRDSGAATALASEGIQAAASLEALVAALALEVPEGRGVFLHLRHLFRGFLGQLAEVLAHFGAVEIVLSAAFVPDQSAAFQLGELRGNPALAHAEQLLQISHAEGLRVQKQQDSQPRGIREQLQGFQH